MKDQLPGPRVGGEVGGRSAETGSRVRNLPSLPTARPEPSTREDSQASGTATVSARTFHGIDFSGDHRMWTPGCRRSNVWIATAMAEGDAMRLLELRPVQQLPGAAHPFERLVALLGGGDYRAAAIDAPFSLPARHIPVGGWPTLLQDVEGLPTESRPFAKGEHLVRYAQQNASLEQKKPLRSTEQHWADRGFTIRSTLWNDRRPGAPFTVACLTLLAKVNGPVWPWTRASRGLLVEAFPAGQLYDWGLTHRGYSAPLANPTRDSILEGVSQRIEIPDRLRRCCRSNPDALDAVLCVFAAKAAADGLSTPHDPAAAASEGWIATHPNT